MLRDELRRELAAHSATGLMAGELALLTGTFDRSLDITLDSMVAERQAFVVERRGAIRRYFDAAAEPIDFDALLGPAPCPGAGPMPGAARGDGAAS